MPKTSGWESSVKLYSPAQVMATAILLALLGWLRKIGPA